MLSAVAAVSVLELFAFSAVAAVSVLVVRVLPDLTSAVSCAVLGSIVVGVGISIELHAVD